VDVIFIGDRLLLFIIISVFQLPAYIVPKMSHLKTTWTTVIC